MVVADATDPLAVAAAVGEPAEATIVCVDAPGAEHGAILATADGGTVVFFSMATSFAQAALGAEVSVETLDAREALKVPAGTQTGTVFRLKGHGMPVLGGRGRGDLFVSVTVVTPTTLTREQRKLLEQLAQIEEKDLSDKGLMDKVRDIFG